MLRKVALAQLIVAACVCALPALADDVAGQRRIAKAGNFTYAESLKNLWAYPFRRP
jgi:hypothetical protein